MIETNMKDECMMEKAKELLELSLVYGRRIISPQTGFIHHFYRSQDNEVQQSIPLHENLLFSLILLRTRLVENITEAKILIEKLLHFQNRQINESTGNFPVYLHEYPACYDHFQSITLLAPLYWILKHYGRVLGQELKNRLEESIKAIFIYVDRLEETQEFPYSVSVRLAAARIAYGRLWNNQQEVERGESVLNKLQALNEVDCWHTTEKLSDLIIALQMVYPSIKQSPWKVLWNYLETTWDQHSGAYVGPCIKEEQKKEEPSVGAYDYFLSYYTRHYTPRIKVAQISLLKVALLNPSEDVFDDFSAIVHSGGTHWDNQWNLIIQHDWACALLEKQANLTRCHIKTYSPFRLVWSDISRVHSFVCQSLNANKVTYTIDDSVFNLFFHLESCPDLNEREKQKEISFFLDFDPNQLIRVDGLRSSTFELGQSVTIQLGNRMFSLSFECLEGNGNFLGHIMRGNRPSQIEIKGENRFKSYDWAFFMRTIRRAENCIIRAQIRMLS